MKEAEATPEDLCNANFKIYTAQDAASLFAGRRVCLWGAGQKGRGFKLALERNGFTVDVYLDKSPLLIGKSYQGVPILDPQQFLGDARRKQDHFILVSSVDRRNVEIFRECEAAGLVKGKDFINIQELSPYYPTVEVSGVCNLKCMACPRGNSLHPPSRGGFMKAGDYRNVAEKLLREIPFLYLVDLYVWGEPLLNPDLPEIIRINNSLGIASGISSNLNAGKNLESVVQAGPAQIRVSVSGYGEKNYEVTHTGGKWQALYKNLMRLDEYIRKYGVDTLVEVYFHVNKQNIAEYAAVRELCERHGFRLMPSISMVFPNYVMDLLDKKELCDEAVQAMDLMVISVEQMLEDASKDARKHCLLRRIIPVVNWDLSVLPCCNYFDDKIADSYLQCTFQEIAALRKSCALCRKCQSYAMHRYFNPGLYAPYVTGLVESDIKASCGGCQAS